MGLLRQAAGQDDAEHRVRRDAAERMVEQALAGHVPVAAAAPALQRVFDDVSHEVRRAAALNERQRVQADYQSTGVCIDAHPMELMRPSVGVSNCVSPAGLGCGAWPETSNWPCW